MQNIEEATVYIVDDDASVREALAWMLRTRRLHNVCFDTADLFLNEMPLHFHLVKADEGQTAHYAAKHPSCLLLDVRMPGTSGLALFEKIIRFKLLQTLPVIFLTGHADLPTAVDTVKLGAFDFCEKPFSNNALVDKIQAALASSDHAVKTHKRQQQTLHKFNDLSEREVAVTQRVVAGLSNKVIAHELGISVRTVEVHRARVFEKMDAKSAVDLANQLRDLPQ